VAWGDFCTVSTAKTVPTNVHTQDAAKQQLFPQHSLGAFEPCCGLE
jgi:hypothetical protein